MYQYYVEARNLSWKVLLECGIDSLPVDLNEIATFYDIQIMRYSKCGFITHFNLEAASGDGFITRINDKRVILLNDKIKTKGRRRFTVGHELGHGLLNHPVGDIATKNSEIDDSGNILEVQANVFSRDILAPACVLNELGVTSVDEIMNICQISKKSAEIRLERLKLLRERKAWYYSPLEKKVFIQFLKFIKDYKRHSN